MQATLEKVRALSQALHPVMLEEVGFDSALDTFLPVFERRTGVEIRYERTGEGPPVHREAAIHLYRVVQEALNNVARHSRSRQADVRLKYDSASVILEIEDQGVGFQDRTRQGMGLISMRERAELVHGRIEFLDSVRGGALIRMTVPLGEEQVHAASSA